MKTNEKIIPVGVRPAKVCKGMQNPCLKKKQDPCSGHRMMAEMGSTARQLPTSTRDFGAASYTVDSCFTNELEKKSPR